MSTTLPRFPRHGTAERWRQHYDAGETNSGLDVWVIRKDFMLQRAIRYANKFKDYLISTENSLARSDMSAADQQAAERALDAYAKAFRPWWRQKKISV